MRTRAALERLAQRTFSGKKEPRGRPLPDDLGGYVRMYEVAEVIRRGAPVYLKFGLSKAPGIYPYGHHMRDLTLATARERVRRGRLALDLLARHGAGGDMAPLGSRLPGTLRRFDTPS